MVSKVKSSFKAKAVTLAKTIAKTRAGYICEKCGKSKEQGFVQHGAHIMPVTYAATAADPDNIIDLCGGCHSMGPKSAHQQPIGFARWFDEKFPGRYDRVYEKALVYSINPFPKIDWEEVYEKLKTIQAELGPAKELPRQASLSVADIG